MAAVHPAAAATSIASLKRYDADDKPAEKTAADPKPNQPTKFVYDGEINKKIILWEGDITVLQVDAIVNASNESLTDRSGICGPDYALECMKLEGCRTGEAKMTKGFDLPALAVIHSVGPRFNVKYRTAAENALHNCYRSCLQLLKENKMSSIAFTIINSEKRGYPSEAACHIVLRTVRRFLEHFGSGITDVIFVMPTSKDHDIYSKVLPLYFPHSPAQALQNKALLPEDTGNEYGETIVEERKIRIDPALSSTSVVSGGPAANPFATSGGQVVSEPDIDSRKAYERAQQADDPDAEERREHERLYQRYLRRARQEKFTDLLKMNFLYQAGSDHNGRPVIVIVMKNFPADKLDMERVLLFIISTMDSIGENAPDFSWLRTVHSIFDRKYKKNMKKLFIVHPSFWLKTLFWFLTPFVSEKVWAKMVYVESVYDLYKYIDREQLDIPDFVFSYDISVNGSPAVSIASSSSSSSSGEGMHDAL